MSDFGTLTIILPDGRQYRARINQATYTIGSDSGSSLRLPAEHAAPRHAQIVSDNRGSRVIDLGSPAGTRLDGKGIAPHQDYPLSSGVELGIGTLRLRVQLANDDLLNTLLGVDEAKPGPRPTQPLQRPAPGPAPQGQASPPPPPPTAVPAHTPIVIGDPLAQAPQQLVPARPGQPEISVRVSPDNIQVEPGKTVNLRVSVQKRGGVVDQVELGVEGIPSRWARIAPEFHDLYPGSRASESTIQIQPPRSPQAEARTYAFNVVANSRESPESLFSAPVLLTLLPYGAFEVVVDPPKRTATRSGGFDVLVSNTGNQLETYRLNASGDDNLNLRFGSQQIQVPRGERRLARLGVSARRIKWVGGPVDHNFTVVVESDTASAPSVARGGTFAQQPPFSTWLLAGTFLLLLVSCLAIGGFLASIPIGRYLEARAATASAEAATATAAAGAVANVTGTAVQRATDDAFVREGLTATAQLIQGETAIARTASAEAVQAVNELTKEAVRANAGAAVDQLRQEAASAEAARQAERLTQIAEQQIAELTRVAQNQNITFTAIAQRATQAAQQATVSAEIANLHASMTAQAALPVTGTPVITGTQTAVAASQTTLALDTIGRYAATLTSESIRQTETARAWTPTPTITPTAVPALPATERTIAFRELPGQPDPIAERTTISSRTFEQSNLFFCFFRYDPLEDPHQVPLSEAYPELAAVSREQPQEPCLPEFTSIAGGPTRDAELGATGRSFNAAIYPPFAVDSATEHTLTADLGPNEFERAVAAIIFPAGNVSQVTVRLWHPVRTTATYRMYALDESGRAINNSETLNLSVPGFYNITVRDQLGSRTIRGVLVMAVQPGSAPDIARDVRNVPLPVYLSSVTLPVN